MTSRHPAKEVNVNHRDRIRNAASLALTTIAIAAVLAGCAQSTAPEPTISERVENQNPAPPPPPLPQMAPASAGATSQLQPGPATQGLATQAPAAQAGGDQFEAPPVVSVTELLAASALSGPGYTLGQQVPTNGAMGQYTIVADASVFHNDAGTYQVESLGLLKIRLAEMPAITKLEDVSKTEVFAQSLASSAERPVEEGAQMVAHPLDTVTGLPSGVGEFFGRVKLGAGTLWSTASNSSEGGGERATQTAEETGDVTLTALGYEQIRRELAKKLHVDPYTTNPILKRQLNQIAWVMFSGRMTVDAVIDVAVPGSMLITGVSITDNMIYDIPKGDLILYVEKHLKKMGLAPADIATFTHNPAIPLSVQVSAVEALDTLGRIPGRRAVVVAIGNVLTEYQARYAVTALGMLVEWDQNKSPIVRIGMPGPIVGQDQNGSLILPAPVDYVSWTPRIAGFVTEPGFADIQNRVLWITGGMTPLARQQLIAKGWTLPAADATGP